MKRLYIVDDSDQIRQRLIELLSGTQNISIVGQAPSAEAAAPEIASLLPDTLLLDIRLPGRSGLDLLGDLKQRYPAMRVILMTNYDDALYRRQGMKAGADAFFNKTTQFEQMLAALKKA